MKQNLVGISSVCLKQMVDFQQVIVGCISILSEALHFNKKLKSSFWTQKRLYELCVFCFFFSLKWQLPSEPLASYMISKENYLFPP